MGRRNRDESVFGGPWRRPRQDGWGTSRRELEDRASYDQEPDRKPSRRDRKNGEAR